MPLVIKATVEDNRNLVTVEENGEAILCIDLDPSKATGFVTAHDVTEEVSREAAMAMQFHFINARDTLIGYRATVKRNKGILF
jgi:hypothetical protein